MSEVKMKNCPFCGGGDIRVIDFTLDDGGWTVECYDCGAYLTCYEKLEWNKRAIEDELNAENETLLSRINEIASNHTVLLVKFKDLEKENKTLKQQRRAKQLVWESFTDDKGDIIGISAKLDLPVFSFLDKAILNFVIFENELDISLCYEDIEHKCENGEWVEKDVKISTTLFNSTVKSFEAGEQLAQTKLNELYESISEPCESFKGDELKLIIRAIQLMALKEVFKVDIFQQPTDEQRLVCKTRDSIISKIDKMLGKESEGQGE